MDDDDRERLKLLNLFDPHVAEFFFGGHTIIVEGDTEYTAFKYVISKTPERYRNIHIVRARGKATIVSLCKILNHFGNGYSVLHDTDFPVLANGNKNPAWAHNASILEVVNASPVQNVRHLSSMPNLEAAYFGQLKVNNGKPYNALIQIQSDSSCFRKIEEVLQSLINLRTQLTFGCISWGTEEELLSLVLPLQQVGATVQDNDSTTGDKQKDRGRFVHRVDTI